MTIAELLSVVLSVTGAFFFLAGSIGMARLPDVFTRLHAATKADNIGLAFLLAGAAIHAGSFSIALKLSLIWLLLIISSATSCNLIVQKAIRDRTKAGESS